MQDIPIIEAEVINQEQNVPGADMNIMFPQPLPLPPPIAVPPPKDASITFYGLEDRADSYHSDRTGLKVGMSDINGKLVLDVDKETGTMRCYAVGVRAARIEFNLSYFSNSNGNLIQHRPAAT